MPNTMQLFLFILLSLCAVASSAFGGIRYNVDEKTGEYDVRVKDKTWLKSAWTYVHLNGKMYSTHMQNLRVSGSVKRVGRDNLGEYEETVVFFKPKLATNTSQEFETRFRTYFDKPFILFGQEFHGGEFQGTSMGNRDELSSSFPSFSAESSVQLGFLAYGGIMVGDTDKAMGRWPQDASNIKSGLDSGPLVLFDREDSAIVVSPFNHFMAVSAMYREGENKDWYAHWGFLGTMENIPDKTHYWTIMYYSDSGIRRAMAGWGDVLKEYYQKDPYYMESDFTLNYIGFWTDGGAYYYYRTEDGKSYEQTILDVYASSKSQNLPYRYVQYDSWFYPKDDAENRHGGVTEWYARKDVFPDGMQYIWNQTGWPYGAHNRWWSPKNVYAKQNGGKYEFIIEEKTHHAMPRDAAFWDDLLKESKKWGLILYEQDWLNDEFNEMECTVSDIHIGRDWLLQMGKGAWKNGMTIQYCMSPSRAVLQSLEIPTVTQARASGDYKAGNDQWKIGVSSIFAHAIGIAPFKDNFFTTDKNQSGLVETNPVLQSLVATLSTGPVGPSDKIGYSDVELIMKSCNAEGLLLKPERPARAVNDHIIMTAFREFRGQVWTTHTEISGHTFGIILGADFNSLDQFAIDPRSAEFEIHRELPRSVVFAHDKKDAPFSKENPLMMSGCTTEKFCLYYVSPVFNVGGKDLIIYGEMDKWVPMSKQRVKNIDLRGGLGGADNVKIEIEGAVGETVSFYMSYGGENIVFKCEFYGSGTRIIDFMDRTCVYN